MTVPIKPSVTFANPPVAGARLPRGADDAKGSERLLSKAQPLHIPRLDARPIEGGGTMNQQAALLTDPTSPLSPTYNPALVMERKGQSMNKGPFEALPEEAAVDPRYRQGMGARIAGNQPQLATEDGVYKPPLSKESIDVLQEFAKKAEAAQTASVVQPPTLEERGAVAEKEVLNTSKYLDSELRSMLGDDDNFDHLNNPQRRKEIEARLAPLDLTDYIIQGELRQEIPIVKGKLTIVLRSPSINEDLEVKRLMYDKNGSERYMMDSYIVMNLTLALFSINGQELPTHLKQGEFDETLFMKKLARVKKMPMTLMGDFGIQYSWFDLRIRKLLANQTDELKKY